MRTIHYETDLCVVGGGLSGLCCAIGASRSGIKTVLVHDRAVLGGNASEEVRMWICGAHGRDMRETGIIEELVLENFYQNTGLKYPIWSSVLYEKAMAEPNLTLLLNTVCFDAVTEKSAIKSIRAYQSNAETFHEISAKYFADCSGDSILAPLSGAAYMYGREAKSDYNETIPPDTADKKTMGMSCLFQIRETDHKTTFTPPKWAYSYPTDADLPYKDHDRENNFWWIELGGDMDAIHDTDKCRDELLKICYGIWDHMKNHGDHGVDNFELEWIGFLPGKRESRRYKGKHVITQNDVEAGGKFPDIIAYAGWTMDDHFPEGFHYNKGHPTIYHPAPSPWGIPLRSLISENIENLVFAGRNISVTHAALSSSRVMATCAILGEALGRAVALAIQSGVHISKVDIGRLQDILKDNDLFIPGHKRKVSHLTMSASCTADIVRNGTDRGEDNLWKGKEGDTIVYEFSEDSFVSSVRLVFDSDLNRPYHNMPCCYHLHETEYRVPKTLITEYKIESEDSLGNKSTVSVSDNHGRIVCHSIGKKVKKIKFVPLKTNGAPEFRLFSFELK